MRIADEPPADQPHQPIGEQNITIPEKQAVNKTEDHQQRQARLYPARAAFEQKLKTCAKQQCKQGEEFDLSKEIEDRPRPGIATGNVAIPGRIEISRLRQTEGADIQQQDTENGDAANKIERDVSLHGPCPV